MERGALIAVWAALIFVSARPVRAGLWDTLKKGAKQAAEKAERSRERNTRSVRDKDVSAVRGLEEDKGAAGSSSARDFAGLDWIEKLDVSEDEVDRFIREGRLKK